MAIKKRKSKPRRRLAPEVQTQRILDGALDLYSRRLFTQVSTRDIAKRCGVNVALIYYYFKNKDILVQSVLEHAIERALERYRERSRTDDAPVVALNKWLQVIIDSFAPLKQMSQILISYNAARRGQHAIAGVIDKLYSTELNVLRDCLKSGIAQAQFRNVDPAKAAVFISTHLDGLFFVSMTRPWTDMRPIIDDALQSMWDYLGISGKHRALIESVAK